MAVGPVIGVGTGIGAGEMLVRAHHEQWVDTGTLVTGLIGTTAGFFGPLMVNTASGKEVFSHSGARAMAATGIGMYWWAAARFHGVAPKPVFQPPEEVNVAESVISASLTGIAVAGLVTLIPAARSLL